MANFFDQFDGAAEVTPSPTQQAQGNFFDQFEPESAPQPVAATSGGESVAGGQNFFDQFDAPKERPGFVSSLTSGFTSGLLEQNPDLAAEALEGAAHLVGEGTIAETLRSGSDAMRKLKSAPDPQLSGIRLRDVAGIDDALTWAGEALGGGLASAVPSIAIGGAGALAGGALAGPPGAVVGGLGGALASSAPFNYGEVYKELKHHGVDPKLAAEYAGYAAIPMAGLDVASIGPIITRLGGVQVAKKELSRILAQRIAAEAAKGAGREGITEAAQEVIKQATVSLAADQPFWSVDNVWNVVESGAAGALTGGAIGGVSGIPRDRVTPRLATEEEVASAFDEISGARKGGAAGQTQPAAPEDPSSPLPAPVEGMAASVPPAVGPATQAQSEALAAPIGASEAGSDLPPQPVFYSQVKMIAEQKLPESFTSEQMLATLRNTPGVKEEELLWLNVPEFAKKEGKISKTDFLTHLEENEIRIEDVEYSSGNAFQTTLVEEVEFEANSPSVTQRWQVPEAPGWRIERVDGVNAIGEPSIPTFEIIDPNGRFFTQGTTLEEAQGRLNRHLSPPSQTTYSSWQALKGGENYRERLLRLPDVGPSLERQTRAEYNAAIAQGETSYQSPHWDPTNVVAHYRTADFTDVEGKRGMAVQEIQSDWHQAGRKAGYRVSVLPPYYGEVFQAPNGRWGFDSLDRQFGSTLYDTKEQAENSRAFLEESRIDMRPPDAPFKTNWAELTVKRILRQAADEGYERVYFTPGRLHAEMYRQSGENAAGQVEFYDKILPRIVDKWAKKLGGKMGKTEVIAGRWIVDYKDGFTTGHTTQEEARQRFAAVMTDPLVPPEHKPINILPETESVFYLDLTPTMASNVQRGLPMFATLFDHIDGADKMNFVPSKEIDNLNVNRDGTQDLSPMVEAANVIVQRLVKKFGIDTPVYTRIGSRSEYRDALGFMTPWVRDGKPIAYVITIVPNMHIDQSTVYAVVAHEFGHVIQKEKFDRADSMTQLLVLEEYHKYRDSMSQDQVTTMGEVARRRDNFLIQVEGFRPKEFAPFDFRRFAPEKREYWLGFEEWFAENVARWMTTNERALTHVEKLFKSIADGLRAMYEAFKVKTGLLAEANQQIAGFLEALEHQEMNLAATIEATKKSTQEKNAAALRRAGYPDHPASEMTTQTGPGRGAIKALVAQGALSGSGLAQAQASAAMADNYSKWYKWGLSVIQLAETNPHITSLFRYKEFWQQKTLERQQIMDSAHTTVKAWRKMSTPEADALAGLIDDYMNMDYLTPQERAAGVTRMPTQQELMALVAKNKVTSEGLALFTKIQSDFKGMLVRYRDVLNAEAMKISDPYRRADRMRSVQQQFDALDKQPYFPAMRFGDLTIEVRDAAGDLVEFQTFESKRARGAAESKLKASYPAAQGFSIKLGKLPEDAGPLVGLPPGFLDLIGQKLNLSPSQQGSLELLRFQLSPAQSFKHRFERKNRVKGYSFDFQRAYANYFFHGSNHLTRIKYMDEMRQVVKDLRDESRQMLDGTKRMQIADFVNDHLNYHLDPKSDWSTLRALTFLWALGFSPAAALLNTTQIMVGSYPILASGFGDVKTLAALSKAGAQLSTYYKKGTLAAGAPTDFHMRALSEGVKEGVITEAMAPELAAISEGNNLRGSVGGYAHASWIKTMEWAGKLFEMTEQWNRRVTFRAALQLALDNPTAKYVDEAVRKNELQYQRLRSSGWSEREAKAFVTAKYATESTQYIYAQYAQPRLMRGKLRTVFIFKSFVQNTLFMLWNNPSAAARSLLVMAALGGMMGLPGMEDLKGLMKVIAKRVFGSDFDLDDAARKFAVDTLNGTIPPDLLLHGLSRYGMGIPAAMNWVGIPAPIMDMSRSVSMGNILPVQLDAMFGGGIRPERQMLDSVQRAAGASFGIGFNIWKAINDSQQDLDSLARWTKAFPRQAQAISRFYQAFSQGEIRNRSGAAIVKFDPYDTRHMMEMLALAGGWQPLRLTAQWDRIIAEREAIEYWDLRRQGLLRQYSDAIRTRNEADIDRARSAIQRFNSMLPDAAKAKAITRDTLTRSLQTRERLRSLQEQGLPAQKSNASIVREIQRLHPEAQVDVRPIR